MCVWLWGCGVCPCAVLHCNVLCCATTWGGILVEWVAVNVGVGAAARVRWSAWPAREASRRRLGRDVWTACSCSPPGWVLLDVATTGPVVRACRGMAWGCDLSYDYVKINVSAAGGHGQMRTAAVQGGAGGGCWLSCLGASCCARLAGRCTANVDSALWWGRWRLAPASGVCLSWRVPSMLLTALPFPPAPHCLAG